MMREVRRLGGAEVMMVMPINGRYGKAQTFQPQKCSTKLNEEMLKFIIQDLSPQRRTNMNLFSMTTYVEPGSTKS